MGLLKSIGGGGSGLTADQLALIVNATSAATPNTLVLRDGSGNASVHTLSAFTLSASGLTVSGIQGVESMSFDANVDNIIYARYSTDEGSGVLVTFHDSFTNTDTLTLGGNYINTASGVFSSSLSVGAAITTAVGGVSALNIGAHNGSPLLNGGVVGNYNYAGSVGATAFGFYNNATGASVNSTTGAVTGTPTSATVGKFSTAIGYSNRASADWGVAVGYNNVVTTGPQNVAIGYGCQATGGQQSAAFGISVTNTSANSVLVGWSTRTLKFDSLGISTGSPITSTNSIEAASFSATGTVSGDLYSNYYGQIDGAISDLYTQISNVTSGLGDMAYQNSGSVSGFTIADNNTLAFNANSLGGYQIYVYNYDFGDYAFTLDDGGNASFAGVVSIGDTLNGGDIWANALYSGGGSTANAIGVYSPLSLTGPNVTGSSSGNPEINITQTWNTTGTPTLIKANVTNTASNGNAKLLDLQTGGVSRFSVNASGDVVVSGSNGVRSSIFYTNSIYPGVLTTTVALPAYVSALNATTANLFAVTMATHAKYTQTSGANGCLAIIPVYNQTSGTAANTDLLINRTQTAVGSGTQLLIDAQVGGTSKFSVSNTGKVVAAAAITHGVGSLTDAATVATDASAGNHFRVTLGGNRTLGNPTNGTDGQRVTWELIQDGTGSRTITLDTKFALGNDISSVTLTTTASKRDFLSAVYNSGADKWYVVGFVGGY